jgi:CubicO group peptidase (beta-lactamase class C family)/peptidoglycan/LPS O-acetylase OafA/YrhL
MAATLTAAPAPAAPDGTTGRRAGGRDGFLDTIRSISIVRVVLWHAFGAAVITYVVAAVPAMFFVTGSLLAQSLDRKGARATLHDRLRRLLVPFWVFGAAAVAIMAVADVVVADPGTSLPWARLAWWVLPLGDPGGSAWQAGWLTDPLWYLRAMLWVLLLAPFLLRLTRRFRRASLAGAVLAVVVLDLVGRDVSWLPTSLAQAPWLLGDLALYGGFAMLGMAHHDGLLDGIGRRVWLELAALSAGVAAWWILTQPVEGWVVNNSHPAHLLVGFTWLSLGFAARGTLASTPDRRVVGPLVRFVNQRSLTIYLWHSATIITAYQLLWHTTDRLPTGLFSTLLLAMVAAMTTAAVLAFGWVEDKAGRRRARLWPVARRPVTAGRSPRRPAFPALAFGAFGLALVATAGVAVTRPDPVLAADGTPSGTKHSVPAPSRQPNAVTFQAAPASATPTYTGTRTAVYGTTTTTPTTATTAAAPAASDAGGTPTPAADAPTTVPVAQVPLAPPASPALSAQLQDALDAWVAQMGIPGASLGVVRPGDVVWTGVDGADLDGTALTVDSRFSVASVTKTFTGALVMREVAKGTIQLDEPLPVLTAVPDFPYAGRVTVRQLLDHSSGLENYRDTPEFPKDPSVVVTPEDALRMTGDRPLLFPPGSKHEYSSSNYLVLGLLLEQVTMRSYDSLIGDLVSEFGHTTHDQPGPGEPNAGAAGVVSDLDDLLRWGTAELRDHAAFPEALWDQYGVVDTASMVGPVWGYCPCTLDAAGTPVIRAIGQSGSTTLLAYARSDDLVTVINLPSGLWDSDARAGQVTDFLEQVRTIVDRAAAPAG